jgi:hypothetical protein
MKNVIVFLLFISFVLSCKKNEDTIKEIDGIIICDYRRNDITYDSLNSISNCNCIRDTFDLNKDGKTDIKLGSYYYHSPNGYSGGTYISIIDSAFMYSLNNIDGTRFKCGDTISAKLIWTNNNYIFQSHDVLYPNGGTENHIINWTVGYNDSAYIAVRYNISNEYKYGWIKVKDSEINAIESVLEK